MFKQPHSTGPGRWWSYANRWLIWNRFACWTASLLPDVAGKLSTDLQTTAVEVIVNQHRDDVTKSPRICNCLLFNGLELDAAECSHQDVAADALLRWAIAASIVRQSWAARRNLISTVLTCNEVVTCVSWFNYFAALMITARNWLVKNR